MVHECEHYDEQCWAISYSNDEQWLLCQKCSEKEAFSDEVHMKRKMQLNRTPDEIITNLKERIKANQSATKSLEKMITKQEKLK